MENLPSKSVVVPVLIPSTLTLTPISGSFFSSTTLPVICLIVVDTALV